VGTRDNGGTEPLVSVIVPTYGRDANHFRAALRSVFAQTHWSLEVIVVDDAPTPVALPEDPPVPIRRIRADHDGVAAARNSGIEAADGAFLAFLDDDDRWRPRKIERQIAALREGGPAVSVVVSGQQFVDGADEPIGTAAPSVDGDATVDLLCGRVNVAFSTLLVRMSAVEAAGGLDERFAAWEDLEWCLRLSTVGEFRSVSAPLVVRRDGEHDQLTDDFPEMRDCAYPLFLEKHRQLAAEHGPTVERQFVAALSRLLGGEGLDNGHYTDARRYLWRSIRHDPRSPATYLYFLLSLGGRYTYQPAKALKRRLAAGGRTAGTIPTEGTH